MPKGSLWKDYHPKGIIKVVNLAPSGCRSICQKPFAASKRGKKLGHSSWKDAVHCEYDSASPKHFVLLI